MFLFHYPLPVSTGKTSVLEDNQWLTQVPIVVVVVVVVPLERYFSTHRRGNQDPDYKVSLFSKDFVILKIRSFGKRARVECHKGRHHSDFLYLRPSPRPQSFRPTRWSQGSEHRSVEETHILAAHVWYFFQGTERGQETLGRCYHPTTRTRSVDGERSVPLDPLKDCVCY